MSNVRYTVPQTHITKLVCKPTLVLAVLGVVLSTEQLSALKFTLSFVLTVLTVIIKSVQQSLYVLISVNVMTNVIYESGSVSVLNFIAEY